MLVECGFVRAVASDGMEFTFTPSFGRIATLGAPHEIVDLFVDLHGPDAAQTAAHVLAGLCDQEDPTPLIGEPEATAEGVRFRGGEMPPGERVIIARHLMQHGVIGTARPEREGSGRYSKQFNAAEYVAAARVHLGLSSADAEALSMTEFQQMLAMKFPDAAKAAGTGGRDIPTREEYEAGMARLKERSGG